MRFFQAANWTRLFQFARGLESLAESIEQRLPDFTRGHEIQNAYEQLADRIGLGSLNSVREAASSIVDSARERAREFLETNHRASDPTPRAELVWNLGNQELGNPGTEEIDQPIAPRIVNGTPTSGYASVGVIGDSRDFFCSGTLIASRYVLTAAHCAVGVAATAGRFLVNGVTYATSRVFVHPQYNDNTLANDIAIYELNRDVTGVTPTQIFRGTPQVGQLLTLVGFGAGGTGTTGHDGSFGTKRFGTTPIDGVEPTLLTWRFDNNSESNTAPGDSGGAAFVTVNGIQYLAGITSGGSNADAGIGDESFDTRVDAFKTWIDSVTGGGGTVGGGSDDHANAPGANATRLTFDGSGLARGTGVLETGTDRDFFRFDLSGAGTATIDLAGSNGLDTYLRVYNAAGQLVGENDDVGNTLNSRLALDLAAGTYYASAGSYSDSGTGGYSLSVQQAVASADDHGSSFATASPISLNSLNRGVVNAAAESGADVDMFRFLAPASGSFAVRATGLSDGIDPILEIYNGQGERIAFNDDWSNTLNSRVLFQVEANTTYFVRLSTYGDTQGDYRLNLVQRDVLNLRSALPIEDRVSLNLARARGGTWGTLDSPIGQLSKADCNTSPLAFPAADGLMIGSGFAGAAAWNQKLFDPPNPIQSHHAGLVSTSV